MNFKGLRLWPQALVVFLLFALPDYLGYTEKQEGKEPAMNPSTTEVDITGDHKLSLDIDLPEDVPTGAAIVTLTVEPKPEASQPVNRAAEIRGMGKGKVWMAEDFDAPLEAFAEYMECGCFLTRMP
jgi:hypothetical protein